MNEQVFVRRHESEWARLAQLCDIADVSMKRLQPDELREFVRLYRRASADLSLARTRSTNLDLTEHLNDLCGRAYGLLYRAPRKTFWKAILDAVATMAQTVRRRKAFVIAAMVLFFGAGVFSFMVQEAVPDARDFFIPPGFEQSFDMWKSGQFDERGGSESALATGFYASNNPRAAMMTGAIGAGTFGIGSVYLLFTNGALIGSLSHEVAPLGHLDFLYSSILPHGIPELSGLFFAGAAGLLLGAALVAPGRRSRGDALRAVGRDAITLIAGSVVMMLIAAPIEGFLSFNPAIPGWFKMGFAGVSLLGWLAFWRFFGRTEEERAATARSAE